MLASLFAPHTIQLASGLTLVVQGSLLRVLSGGIPKP